MADAWRCFGCQLGAVGEALGAAGPDGLAQARRPSAAGECSHDESGIGDVSRVEDGKSWF